MHVNKTLETVLLTAVEQPVDGALLIRLAVVLKEVLQKVAANHLARGSPAAKGLGNKREVLLEGLLAIHRAHKVDKVAHDVVVKVLVVGDGQHVIGIGHKGHMRGVGHLGQIVGNSGALVCQHQAIDIERIAAKHAAHGIAYERGNLVALGAHVLVALVALRNLFCRIEDARHRDVLVLDLDGHLALHVVDLGKDPVELLLVGAKLLKASVDLGLASLVFFLK